MKELLLQEVEYGKFYIRVRIKDEIKSLRMVFENAALSHFMETI